MSKSETVNLIIRARDAASQQIRQVDRVLGGMRTNVKNLTSSVFNLKTGIAGLVTALGVRSFVRAANEQAMSVEGLETAMRSMGRYTPELSKKLQDQASALQAVTNFGDEATIQGQKFLITYRGITDDLLPDTTKAMLDLAALMGGDAVAAANMLGKASMGMTGELRRVGITVDDETFRLHGYAGVLRQIQSQVEGQAEAMRRAAGPWRALGNYIGDVREELGFLIRAVADGIGDDMIESLKLGVEWLKRFRESADFEQWAKKAREDVIGTFERILLGAAGFYDGAAPIIAKIGTLLSAIWDGYRRLPSWVQEIGLVAAILGGKKVAAAVAALSHLYGVTQNIGRALEEMSRGRLSFAEFARMNAQELAAALEELDRTSEFGGMIVRQKIQKPIKDFWAEFDAADTAAEKMQVVLQYMRQLREEREKAEKTKPVTAAPVPGMPEVDYKLLDAQAKAHVDRLKETTRTALLILENTYKDGEIQIEAYFSERRRIMQELFDAELKLVEDAVAKETDAAARVGLETRLIALRENLNRDLIQLERQKQDALSELERQEVERRRIVEAMKLRAVEDGAGILRAAFDRELAEMDYRHQEEIRRLEELNARKEEIDEAYRLQKLEKDRLMLDQERRLMESRMEMARETAQSMAEAFDGLYELTGKKHREFFYLARAAAIAEAIVNTELAVTKALAQGGIWGTVQAAALRFKGMVSVATIAAQRLAAGGLVKGSSPHSKADDKLIRATAGEYMQPVDTVRHYGLSAMEAIKNKLIPRQIFAAFSAPASVKRPAYRFAEGGAVSAGAGIGRDGTPMELTIANFIDPGEFERFIYTARGNRAVLNVIGQNPQTIKRMLS